MTLRLTRAVSGFALVAVAALLVLASAGTALAQYYPPPPPPPTYYAPPPPPPPPPPSYYPPPPPPYPYTPPPLPPPDLEQNDVRLQAGITGISSGYYCASSSVYGSSCSVAFSYWELDLRAAWEIRAKNSPGALTLGFDWLPPTSSYSGQQAIYEPTLDFGVSTTNRRSKVRTRGYIGLGVPITTVTTSTSIGGVQTGSGTIVGAVARFGGGVSAPLAPNFAFGLDIVLSLGGINGFFVSMLSFAAGPEFTF